MRESLKEHGAEFVVIVASILLAFALDAWWDERTERARADELLDAVAVEFEAEVEVLDSILVINEGGGLQHVESIELQRALAGWGAELDDLDWEVSQGVRRR